MFAGVAAYGDTRFTPPAMFYPASDASGEWVARTPHFQARVRSRSIEVTSAGCRVKFEFGNSRRAAPQPMRPLAARLQQVTAAGPRILTGYEELFWKDLYNGIDAQYSPGRLHLKSTFVVRPGADPGQIRIRVSGHRNLQADPHGNLIVRTNDCYFEESRPEVYQYVGGVRHDVPAEFRIDGDIVSFRIGAFDRAHDLVIDPVLTASIRTGHSGIDVATAVALDANGYIYVTGYTDSSTFPVTTGAVKAGGVDVFVAKWRPGGRALVYCTWVGGSADDRGLGIAVTPSGEALVTGRTTSSDFPRVSSLRGTLSGASDAFVLRFSTAGALAWSTFWGGTATDSGTAIAVDAARNVYVGGVTTSADMPGMTGFQQRNAGNADGFVVKFTPIAAVEFGTYIGGLFDDTVSGLAIDNDGHVLITGKTSSMNFPTASAVWPVSRGVSDAYVTKIHRSGGSLVYSTYLGGSAAGPLFEAGTAIATGPDGDAYVAGNTNSSDFPAVNSQAALGGAQDAFLARFTPSGIVSFSRVFGGSLDDAATSIAVDSSGDIFVGGFTASANFPSGSRLAQPGVRSYDGFLSRFRGDGTLAETRFLTGNDMDVINSVAARRPAVVAVAGQTSSVDIVTTQTSGTPGAVDSITAAFHKIPRDFDKNGTSDVILHNPSSGQVSVWYLGGPAGTNLIASPVIGTAFAGWRVVTADDFDGDDVPDIVLQNDTSNAVSFWYMTGPTGSTLRHSPIIGYPRTPWRVVAAADFDVDGRPDLLLQNGPALSVWLLGGPDGSALQTSTDFYAADASWALIAAADTTGDGIPDLIYREKATNEIKVWTVTGNRNSLRIASTYSLGVAAGGWFGQGWGDHDGNGCADVIFENDALSMVSIWYFGGTDCRTRLDAAVVSYRAPGWAISGTR